VNESLVPASRVERRDLDNRAQIHDLVVDFYRQVLFDELLGPVFEEVAEVDWSVHIPKLIDYWCRVLLDQPGYGGHILAPHQDVHERGPFHPELFDRWYGLFAASIDARWEGPIADRAKKHAARMGATLAKRILAVDWTAPGRIEAATAQRCAPPGR
jgi:hemoglobin